MKEIFDFSMDWENGRKDPNFHRPADKEIYKRFWAPNEYSASGYYPTTQVYYKGEATGIWLESGGIHWRYEMENGYLLLHECGGGWESDYFCFIYLQKANYPGRKLVIRDAGRLSFNLGGPDDDIQLVRGGLDVEVGNYGWRDVEIVSSKAIEFSIVPRGRYRLTVNERPGVFWYLFHKFLWPRPWGAWLPKSFGGSHMRLRRLGPWRPEGWNASIAEPPPKTPPIKFFRADEIRRVKISCTVDDDSYGYPVTCRFSCLGDDPAVEEPESESQKAEIGGVEFVFSEDDGKSPPRIHRIQFEASTTYMEEQSFKPIPPELPTENFTIDTNWYGVGVAYYADSENFYDRDRDAFAIRYKSGTHTAKIHRVADTVAIGVDKNSCLTEIRFDDISEIIPPFGGTTVNAKELYAEQCRSIGHDPGDQEWRSTEFDVK